MMNDRDPYSRLRYHRRRYYRRRFRHRKFNILVTLVMFVFFILLISVGFSGVILFCMNHFGMMQPITSNRMPMMLFFLFVVSTFVGLIITIIAGNISLRPMKKFVDATKEIANGNFDVRVETIGPEEFSTLAVSFNEMAKELGSIETLRDDFVSNISHEFKTPVSSILGFAKILKKDNLTKEQHDEYLDIIISESKRLTQLSSNVLLLSKLDSTDKLNDISEFSLDEQLRQVILILDQNIEKKHINIDIQLDSCTINSSQELLQQVWINLINNAIKFTPDGGNIYVQLTNDDKELHVTIRDTGIGMEDAVVKRIYDKFYQGETSHTTEGNGLGLALVKRIIDLCDGTIEVKSELGVGSEFIITLKKSRGDY